ncbi:MAG: thiolase family protein [Deltaproteobacteria bacterium]|nr:thiolase family protein [Deltaproteobacteria bacterium]
MENHEVVIVSAVRTPIGKFGGALKDFRSIDLGALVIKECLRRVGVGPEEVEEVNYGLSVLLEAGLETDIPGRQATLFAGFPPESISLTVNRACCSSLSALRLGYRAIRSGEIDVAMAVGSDNMGRAPHVAPDARWGKRLGHMTLTDPLFALGYPDFAPVARDAGEVAVEQGVSRQEQDEWAVRSHELYFQAHRQGKLALGEELMAVDVLQKKGPAVAFVQDESPREGTTVEQLGKLPTIYGSPTVTAGNAPGLCTGSTCLLMMSAKKAKAMGLTPLATILSSVATATDARLIATIPAPTIVKAVEKAGRKLEDMSLIEINEAFAAMPLVSTKLLAAGDSRRLEELRAKTNVNGGSIAMGHPVGATALRITMTAMYQLRRRGGGYGVAAICGGLAQGEGIVIKV